MPGLEDLYREIILDHYRSPRNKGTLESPPAHHSEGFNPLCGDEVSVYLDVTDGVVRDVRFSGQGCSISLASASMMSVAVKGKTVAEARALTRAFKGMMSIHETDVDRTAAGAGDAAAVVKLGDLEALRGVVKFATRIKCATLAWITMNLGFDEIERPPTNA